MAHAQCATASRSVSARTQEQIRRLVILICSRRAIVFAHLSLTAIKRYDALLPQSR